MYKKSIDDYVFYRLSSDDTLIIINIKNIHRNPENLDKFFNICKSNTKSNRLQLTIARLLFKFLLIKLDVFNDKHLFSQAIRYQDLISFDPMQFRLIQQKGYFFRANDYILNITNPEVTEVYSKIEKIKIIENIFSGGPPKIFYI